MLSAAQILEKIRIWENSGVEFKEVRIGNDKVTDPRRDDLSNDVAAFANHSGGTIILASQTNRARLSALILQK